MREREDLLSQLVSGLGLLLILVILTEGMYVVFVSNPLGMVWVAGLLTSLPFTLGIVYVGAWLPGSSVSASRYNRIGTWCLGGLSVFLLINITIMITMPPESGLQLISWGRWATTLGAGIGLLIGVFEARSIERAVEAERERIRAEEAETREDLLEYLNAALRHEVLNTAGVIVGHADRALAESNGDGTIVRYMQSIKSRTRDMETVIDDVRLLLQASRTQSDAEPIDITDLLTEEIDALRNTHEAVSIDTSLPEQAIVRANHPLRRAFSNLLQNAVEHNDSDTPRVEVTVRRDPETVTVQIADNGPGIPESERETLFEQEIRRDSNHGLGLVLTQTLVDNYNGTLEVTETGRDGTVFTLTLPRGFGPPPERSAPDVQPTSP